MQGGVACAKWMPWFVGVSEAQLIAQRDKFIDENGNFVNPKGEPRVAGVFELPSVRDLRDQVGKMEKTRAASTNACPLKVIDDTDIGDYQAQLRTEDRAMVQIASNFHCLENGSPHCPPDEGRLVEGYCQDCTQGPAASFGVPGAALLRAHYAFRREGTDPRLWGQTGSRQVNLLEDICKAASPAEHFCGDTVNGKARLLGEEADVTPDRIDDVASKVKVGLHSDAQVVFGPGGRGTLRVIESPPLVDQVCTATLCYGYANRLHNPSADSLRNLTRALLRASYEGTYLAAIARGRRKLLLTLIGGASFRNPHDLILAELKRAHDLYASHPASRLEEVQLVLYDKNVASSYEAKLRSIQ
mmetsp:Transcript_75887/g.214593  ORF Transcript_75887/g.214593 Transcript_75887/m.214593 type:complete len:358 (+) Transcript_75887:130-1203(+)